MLKTEVLQSNDITRSVYSMGLQQKRLLSLAILKSNSDGEARFTTQEFSQFFNINNKLSRKVIIDQKVSILELKVILNGDGASFTAFTWVQEFSFTEKSNTFLIKFSDRVTKEITNLRKNLTSYSLLEMGKIKNVNTIRLYEHLSQWGSTGFCTVTVDYLRNNFELPKSYLSYPQMKQKWLTPACEEISEKTNFMVRFDEIKTGNKVTSLDFIFYDKYAQGD